MRSGPDGQLPGVLIRRQGTGVRAASPVEDAREGFHEHRERTGGKNGRGLPLQFPDGALQDRNLSHRIAGDLELRADLGL
jgi:hypothetical protein